LSGHLAFHTNAPRAASPQAAAFALVDVAQDGLDLAVFHQGEAEYPDRSTTIIAIVPSLTGGPVRSITGPGIRTVEQISPSGLPDDFAQQWRSNSQRYPLGVDLLCVAGNQLFGLPRTTRLLEGAA
ncbi:MAG: phosphonate C-P lyase system protein PhnH, partial [Bosea sp. (in: a-proteobacteria)]